jgi:hypothetical protein
LQYKDVETALADIMNVKSKDMGAFRARLRHLRNIELPRLPKPGSGRSIDYTPRQVLQMLLALELENAGQTPRKAAFIAASMVRQSPNGQFEGEDCYVCVTEGKEGYGMMFGLSAFSEFMKKKAPDVFLVINISACVRKLNNALSHALLLN